MAADLIQASQLAGITPVCSFYDGKLVFARLPILTIWSTGISTPVSGIPDKFPAVVKLPGFEQRADTTLNIY